VFHSVTRISSARLGIGIGISFLPFLFLLFSFFPGSASASGEVEQI
jgi:hypothetical protein